MSTVPLAAHITWLARATGVDPCVRFSTFASATRARLLARSDDAIPDVYRRCRRRHVAYALVYLCIEHGEWRDIVRWDEDGDHILVKSTAALCARLEPLFELLQLGSFTTWWRRNTRRATDPRCTIDGARWYRKANNNAHTLHRGMAVCDVRRSLAPTTPDHDAGGRRRRPTVALCGADGETTETDWQRIVRIIESTYETGRTEVATSVARVGGVGAATSRQRLYRCSTCGEPKRGHQCRGAAAHDVATECGYEQKVETAIAKFLSSINEAPSSSTASAPAPSAAPA